MTRKVFISHKNTGASNDAGEEITEDLKARGYDVFFDGFSLEGGMKWRQEILDELLESDVTIVVIDESTSESDWVQREIDIAKIHSIAVLPIILEEDYDAVATALKRFEIEDTQYIKYTESRRRGDIDETLNRIAHRVDMLSQDAIEPQIEAMDKWKARLRKKRNIASIEANAVIFKHPALSEDITFHIVTGDATYIKEFDILVNTENTYMQMARFFETNTLSWSIRTSGALLANFVSIVEDTIQDELYQQIRLSTLPGLPISPRRIIVTSAGHEDSELVERTDYRYILHAASVDVNLEKRNVTPVGSPNLIIKNCFRTVRGIDKTGGNVLYDKDNQLIEPHNYGKISSILFPAFGAGNGGKKMKDAAQDIIKCLRDELPNYIGDTNITKVGFSIFFQRDRDIVKELFQEAGFEIISETTTT